jgi:Uma2 family endonuclease
MPVLAEAPQTPTPPERKLWTRQECEALIAAGIHDLDSYELIEGELIRKVSKNHMHILVTLLLGQWLRRVFGDLSVLQETSIDLRNADFATSIPEPDFAILRRSFAEIPGRACEADLLLAIEVSDTTLNFDRTIKVALYARSAIPEYWVVDTNARRLVVHREPQQGVYQSILTYSEDESISPLAAPTSSLPVRNIFQERTN